MNFIVEEQITWEKFVDISNNGDYIYRGQSNKYIDSRFEEWDVISGFSRVYKKNFKFNSFLSQQLEEDLFQMTYRDYEFVKRTNLDKSNLITRLYFLQHYSIPTCLLDFTRNPLVALYFALSSLKVYKKIRTFNSDGFPTVYPYECHISIYQINHKLLTEQIKVKKIEHSSNDFFLKYNEYALDLEPNRGAHLGIDICPEVKIYSEIDNYNLKKQEGCFILFDNYELLEIENYDLITFLKNYIELKNIQLSEPLVVKYNIPYNSLLTPKRSKQLNYKTVYKYLEEKKITGKNLFNDYQGLKYDFNFFFDKN